MKHKNVLFILFLLSLLLVYIMSQMVNAKYMSIHTYKTVLQKINCIVYEGNTCSRWSYKSVHTFFLQTFLFFKLRLALSEEPHVECTL